MEEFKISNIWPISFILQRKFRKIGAKICSCGRKMTKFFKNILQKFLRFFIESLWGNCFSQFSQHIYGISALHQFSPTNFPNSGEEGRSGVPWPDSSAIEWPLQNPPPTIQKLFSPLTFLKDFPYWSSYWYQVYLIQIHYGYSEINWPSNTLLRKCIIQND